MMDIAATTPVGSAIAPCFPRASDAAPLLAWMLQVGAPSVSIHATCHPPSSMSSSVRSNRTVSVEYTVLKYLIDSTTSDELVTER